MAVPHKRRVDTLVLGPKIGHPCPAYLQLLQSMDETELIVDALAVAHKTSTETKKNGTKPTMQD